MGKEIELKFRIDSAAQMEEVRKYPAFSAMAVSKEELIRMETTYYDTPDGAVSERKWTLRQRMENGVCVTCLKTPGAEERDPASARGEWETEETDLPKAIAKLIADGAPAELAKLTANGTVVNCRASFVRRALLLRLTDGSTCELACDAGELSGGEHCRNFLEIELELKSGAPTQMLALGQHLQERYGLQTEHLSKFARANRLRGV